MTPLGKITFAIIGLSIAGLNGFLWGLILGHIIIDRSLLNRIIREQLNALDSSIQLLLPYRLYRYYDVLDNHTFGKIFGAVLGLTTFGWQGLILVTLIFHIFFDSRLPVAKSLREKFDIAFNKNFFLILGFAVGITLRSKILIFTGIIIGFFADSMRYKKSLKIFKFWKQLNPLKIALSSKEAKQVVLIQAIASLSAKISCSDGRISENEIRIFKKIFNIDEKENAKINNIFYEASASDEDIERHAHQIMLIAKKDLVLQESIIENLFKIAAADGKISGTKAAILKEISDIIGLPRGNFEVIKDNFVAKTADSSTQDYYEILGVFYNASDSEIKRKWKNLTARYHPDKIQAGGGSVDEIRAASIKMSEINNAYQQIMKSRKIL